MPSNECTKCGNTDSYNFALNIGLCNPCIGERLAELEAQLEQHRWIPLSERLPKESGNYLVMIKYTHTICAMPMVDMYSTQDSMWGSSHLHTHWKPIILP